MRTLATASASLAATLVLALSLSLVLAEDARAEEPLGPAVLSADLGVGVSRVLEKSGYGDAAYQVLATSVGGRVRLPESHFTFGLSYVHFQQLRSSGAIRFAFESIGAGLGYEIVAGRVAIRPEALLAYGLPTPKLLDPSVDPGDTSGGLAYGGGVSVIVPARGLWFAAADLQLLHKARSEGSLTFFSAFAGAGLRWSI